MRSIDSYISAKLFLPLAMGILVIAFYTSSLDNPFMLDDHTAIVNNPDVIEPGGLTRLWLNDFWAGEKPGETAYRPFTTFTFHLNARLTGLSPIAFRLVNMMLLGLLGWLIAEWLVRYVTSRTIAWLAAFLFVAHPIHAEAINHIVGRADLLAMIGIVGFLLIHRLALDAALREETISSHNIFRACATISVFLMGLGLSMVAMYSKMTGVLLIPLAVLQGYIAHRVPRKPSQPPRPVARLWFVHTCTLGCVALPLAGYLTARQIVSEMFQSHWIGVQGAGIPDIAANPISTLSTAERFPAALSLVWFYTRQLVWPDTSYDHTPVHLPGMSDASAVLGLIVLVLLVLVLIRTVYRRHWLSLAAALALGQLALVSNLWIRLPQYTSNLMMMPLTLAALMWLAFAITGRKRKTTRVHAIAVIPCVLMLPLMMYTVLGINSRWFSTPRLMASDLSHHGGNPVSMYNYGSALLQAGVYDKAIYWLTEAIDQEPQSIKARHKLALAWLMGGNFNQASDLYKRILDLDPRNLRAHTQLAILAIEDKDLETAQEHIAAAKGVSLNDKGVMYIEAKLASLIGDTPRAIKLYEDFLNRYPDHVSAGYDHKKLLERINHP